MDRSRLCRLKDILDGMEDSLLELEDNLAIIESLQEKIKEIICQN